jgi:hypothetical protein
MSEYIPADLRREVTDRADGCCEYCRTPERFSCDPLTLDHIVPRALNGPTQSDNLALACYGCNQHKSLLTTASDPVTGEPAPLFNPRQNAWAEHFSWSDDFTMVLGLSPTGRATVVALQLNRSGLANLRRVLYGIKEHPRETVANVKQPDAAGETEPPG